MRCVNRPMPLTPYDNSPGFRFASAIKSGSVFISSQGAAPIRIGALDPDKGALVAVPTIDGKRGNPVVWSRRFFPDLMAVEGDVGARHLIGRYGEAVGEVPVSGAAALTDVDTPQALATIKAELEKT